MISTAKVTKKAIPSTITPTNYCSNPHRLCPISAGLSLTPFYKQSLSMAIVYMAASA